MRTEVDIRSDREGARVWVLGALDIIAQTGAHGLRVEPLARLVGVSKGSFYWFFHDVEDLKHHVLVYWRDELNEPVFESIREFDVPLRERLAFLVRQVMFEGLGRYDAAIRAWGLTDRRVRAFVQNVDRTRLAFMEEIFAQGGPASADSHMRAHLFYRAFIAESYVRAYPALHSPDAFMAQVTEFLTDETPRSTTGSTP